jgi:hypothetical protein
MVFEGVQDDLRMGSLEQDRTTLGKLNIGELEPYDVKPSAVKPSAAKACRTVVRIMDGDDENIAAGREPTCVVS